ncbi:MAG: hypothetical protein OEZ43_05165 [Gammaproteobacteria bacterium]|nr:hypothetical protein [Gammaproteobacteria bacterium]
MKALLRYRLQKHFLIASLSVMSGSALADSCYSAIDYIKPEAIKAKRALYLLVDQTTPLSGEMRQNVTDLLKSWGKPGDVVKVGVFSANMQGRFPKVTFDRRADNPPSEKYLWQLRWQDKKDLLACLEQQQSNFQDEVKNAISEAVEKSNSTIPKTELLFSLKRLSRAMIVKEEAEHPVVFLVSNGMENSTDFSFYRGTVINKLPTLQIISKIRRKGLMGFWRGADVYIYGLGVIENRKAYIKGNQLKDLEDFWERYFVEGGGKVKAIGLPELLISSIE